MPGKKAMIPNRRTNEIKIVIQKLFYKIILEVRNRFLKSTFYVALKGC